MDNLTLTLGESGGAPLTPQELEERLHILEDKVKKDAREIVELLRVHFPRYIERAVKSRFEASGEFADGMTNAQVKALKEDVAETGKRAVSELLPSLEEWGIWLELARPAPAAGERRDLAGNPEVNARLQKVGELVHALLERHRFPGVRAEEWKDAYRLPSSFIPGRGLALSLVESYWRNLEEYQGVRDALKSMREREQRAKRSDRWDSV
ncbi:MAG TPA: hypothetical protein VHF22_06800 [Planctomycetota bacterium]|nr:hypothetical protein [Planctomycetota bacterium]